MKFLTPTEARNFYNSGYILSNKQNRKFVTIFSVCGFHFSTTTKRAKKGKQYKLDNPYWTTTYYKNSLISKLRLIVDGKVKLVRRKVK